MLAGLLACFIEFLFSVCLLVCLLACLFVCFHVDNNSHTQTATTTNNKDMQQTQLPFDSSSAMARFDSVLGDDDIPDKNFLLVQILEAKDLKPFVTGKLESTFCQIRLKLSTLAE